MSVKIDHQIKEALEALKQQKLIGLPTETVYGLAAPINNIKMIENIFSLKERPFFDPLIVHVANIAQAQTMALKWEPAAQKLAEAFWPGPLTLVVPKTKDVSDLITSGLDTVGLRCPNHPVALKFIELSGVPFAAPSANKFKKTSPTAASHVSEAFSKENVFVLDGGECQIGIESTIVQIEDDTATILRPGHITEQDIENLGIRVHSYSGTSIVAPGQLDDHYMPKIPLYLSQDHTVPEGHYSMELPDNPVIAARLLYKKLREAPAHFNAITCVVNPSWTKNPKWNAVMDRLIKASTKS